MMASSLAAAANAVAAAATMSGGHSGVGLNNALVGLQGNGLAQAASQQGLSNLNVNPLLCNSQVGTSFYERVLNRISSLLIKLTCAIALVRCWMHTTQI